MKLTKQDLMRLPKERLADLLVEMQEQPLTITDPQPYQGIVPNYCSFAPDGICHYKGLCFTCPYRQITVTYDNANTSTVKED